MFSDWRIWRKALMQAILVFALVIAAAAAGQELTPILARALTRTPEPLLAVCDALDVVPSRALLTGWVERPGVAAGPGEESASGSALDEIATRAMAILAGPDLAHGPQPGEATGPDAAEYTLRTGDCLYRVCSRRAGEGAGLRVYLVCSAEIRQPNGLAERRRRLLSALNSLGNGARRTEPVYSTVFAQLPSVLDDAQCREVAQRAVARLHARQLHEFDGDALYSLLSHSILLGPAVGVAGRQVNLSVVLRPDRETNSTWVVIGTPLCAGDY